jgi:hypothetical protein
MDSTAKPNKPANDDDYEAQTLLDWAFTLTVAIGAFTAFLIAFIYSL